MPPPSIYARNYWAGAGNDAQPVRYRVFVVDVQTGQTIASSGYSGIATAYDNRPASFSGSSSWLLCNRGQYRVDYRIEWLRQGDNALLGWVADRVPTYMYIDQMVGSYAIDRCMRI